MNNSKPAAAVFRQRASPPESSGQDPRPAGLAARIRKPSPKHYLNRELSWLEFNQRVLDEALDRRNPLLERIKFFAIVSSNLDEFFEVRVAKLKQQIEGGVTETGQDGMLPSEAFQAVVRRVRRLVDQQYSAWKKDLKPALDSHGLRLLQFHELAPADHAWLEQYYRTQVHMALTPLAIDPAHPFPQLLNKSLNIMVQVHRVQNGEAHDHLAVVQVPRILPSLIQLPHASGQDYVFMGDLIGHYLADLFRGTDLRGYWHFRVTRNSELYIDPEEVENLLHAVEAELFNRRKGDAVRLELESGCPPDIESALLRTLGLTSQDLYSIEGPLAPASLMTLCQGDHLPELRNPPFLPATPRMLKDQPDLFAAIRERDLLLHHPYESFGSVLEFVEQAAADPNVLAIKMTLYRTGGEQRLIRALIDATRHGKQVTIVVELRARFDEANNIEWSRQLEQAGVHVVFGLVGYKIHAKMLLVVRRDPDGIRRYVHLSTGNYNANTARLYTDLGFLTCRAEFGEDVTNLFNLLTGISQFPGMRKLLVAPFELHGRILGLIHRETAQAQQRLPARIIAKLNSLVDPQVIEALYDASQAGVKIDLIVRGICCLRPGVKGLSENITVRSIVDRFLEHTRVFYFENACRPEVFMGSADWMPRNFFARIETVWPVEDGNLRERIFSEILGFSLADNVKARIQQADGTYRPSGADPAKGARRSQPEFMALAQGTVPVLGAKGNSRPRAYPKVRLAPRPAT